MISQVHFVLFKLKDRKRIMKDPEKVYNFSLKEDNYKN